MARRPQQIIRIAETDMDGAKPVSIALRSVKGSSFSFSNAVASVCGFGGKIVNQLTEAEHKKLEDILTHPDKYGIPVWMCNRRRDPATGQNRHLIASQLEFTQKMDINEMKKIKTYKGVRHSLGLPVRGQRTRSSGRTAGTVGVKRKQKEAPKEAAK